MKTNLDLQSQLTSLSQLIAVKDDLSDQLSHLSNLVDDMQASKTTMQKELETAGDYLLE